MVAELMSLRQKRNGGFLPTIQLPYIGHLIWKKRRGGKKMFFSPDFLLLAPLQGARRKDLNIIICFLIGFYLFIKIVLFLFDCCHVKKTKQKYYHDKTKWWEKKYFKMGLGDF